MIDGRSLPQVPQEVFDRVWGIVKALDDREKHFNDLQVRYRTLASTWLLAAFAGIGFVLFSEKGQPPFPREMLSIGICIAGAFGIFLLWLFDVLVYHDLLVAGYAVGRQLEDSFPWLPPVRSNFRWLTRGPAVRWYIASFYLGGISVLSLLGFAMSFYWQSPCRHWLAAMILVILLFLDSVIIYSTRRQITRYNKLRVWSPLPPSERGSNQGMHPAAQEPGGG